MNILSHVTSLFLLDLRCLVNILILLEISSTGKQGEHNDIAFLGDVISASRNSKRHIRYSIYLQKSLSL